MKLKDLKSTKLAQICLTAGFGLVCLYLAAAPKYSGWSSPIYLGSIVNSSSDDLLPQVSKNGLSLYFASTRPDGFGDEDIWVCQRRTSDVPWGPPVNLGATINTSLRERGTGFSRDGHFLFLVTDRPGGFGGLDIWVSWRANTLDDFGWQPPVNLGEGVNTSSNE